ncbi:hypothetical protein Tco_0588784 [Tanacetum coccineum]
MRSSMRFVTLFTEKIQPDLKQPERPETEDDLTGDNSKQYEADIEAMNLILISIPNDIYNFMDSCQTAKEMWLRVQRLMEGTDLTEVDKETRFNNEFDQFTAEPRESLVSVYNRFLQLMNDLKRNKVELPNQYEKLVIASRAKKLEKTHDPLALVAHISYSSSRSPQPYYVTHPPSMRYSTPTNTRLRSPSNTRNQAVMQADKVNIQSGNVENDGRISRQSYNVQEESAEGSNVQKETRNVQRTLQTSSARNGNPQMDLQDQGVIDSGCLRHMTGNMSYLTDYEEID